MNLVVTIVTPLCWVIDFQSICGVGSLHSPRISIRSVGCLGDHLVRGASKLRRARDSASDTDTEFLAHMARMTMMSVAVLICCCLCVRPALATPAFLRQPSLVSSSANYVTQEVHWFSQRLDHFTSQVTHSLPPVSHFILFHWLPHNLTNRL